MINIEIAILTYIFLSFLLFYYYESTNIEGACTSKPFYLNSVSTPGAKINPQSNNAPGSQDMATKNMISTFVSIMDNIEASMTDIKKKIPIKFNLGVVDNTDAESKMKLHGKLPNVYLNFLMKNPPQGIKGKNGNNAIEFGKTGSTGPIGILGQDGYWGTTKDTLF